ncbi:MAG TPA: restriction endonuclease subunit S [Candidatus Scybalocola faecavium]|nr:restriction endonuclease subunit S [Candidatus Scybalocola faecavium]
MKCIENEIPFEVPEGWAWTRLGTIIFSIQYGLNNSAEAQGSHKLLRITDIQNGIVNWETVPFTSTDNPGSYMLKPGDIVFARTGATVGKSFLITDIPYPTVYASYLIRIRLLENLLPEYVYQFFDSISYWEQISDKSVGVGQPNCNGTSLKELFIPLPPRNEQLRIVSITQSLLNYVNKIDKEKSELLTIITNTKSKILDLAIRGKLVPQDPNDEPASALLERIRAEKEELIRQGKIKRDKKESIIFKGEDNSYYEKIDTTIEKINDEIPFELPVNWMWCRFSEVIELFSGQDLTPDRYSDIPQGIPYLTGASNLERGHVIINRWTSAATTHATIGDLLLIVKGSGVGKMAICNIEDAHIARQIMALRCRNGISQEYLQIVVSAFLTEIIDQANGIIPGIRREVVLNTLFPLPPSSEQLRISAKVKRITDELQTIEKCLS